MKPQKMNFALSKEYRKLKGFITTNNECYYNAIENINIIQRPDLKYVEGVIKCVGFLIRHAWLECKDGIIECTGDISNEKDTEYFPILKFTKQEIYKVRCKISHPPAFQLYQKQWDRVTNELSIEQSAVYFIQ